MAMLFACANAAILMAGMWWVLDPLYIPLCMVGMDPNHYFRNCVPFELGYDTSGPPEEVAKAREEAKERLWEAIMKRKDCDEVVRFSDDSGNGKGTLHDHTWSRDRAKVMPGIIREEYEKLTSAP